MSKPIPATRAARSARVVSFRGEVHTQVLTPMEDAFGRSSSGIGRLYRGVP